MVFPVLVRMLEGVRYLVSADSALCLAFRERRRSNATPEQKQQVLCQDQVLVGKASADSNSGLV